MRNEFNRQLAELNTELIIMGSLCEEAITNAVKYLVDGNEGSKEACLEADRQIDKKERDIETLCIRMILQQQPVAGDLRTVSAALKMISDMERIGDQASDIAEIAAYVTKSGLESETHIRDMADAAIQMVSDSIESFVKMDGELAKRVLEQDDLVDALFDKVKFELIEAIAANKGNGEALIDLLMIAKYFERIGDHAENIAKWVIYSITGDHKKNIRKIQMIK